MQERGGCDPPDPIIIIIIMEAARRSTDAPGMRHHHTSERGKVRSRGPLFFESFSGASRSNEAPENYASSTFSAERPPRRRRRRCAFARRLALLIFPLPRQYKHRAPRDEEHPRKNPENSGRVATSRPVLRAAVSSLREIEPSGWAGSGILSRRPALEVDISGMPTLSREKEHHAVGPFGPV